MSFRGKSELAEREINLGERINALVDQMVELGRLSREEAKEIRLPEVWFRELEYQPARQLSNP